ncbi:hypothetical protein EYF80_024849 [Liparis tanakae]|uniref:Uncharacterized protein n=1 Tax=Liparis tanakae TaxID=230148 RepID=A0A4Z2HI63_9TELE|nr:hypothetical protein EYF80_024849 [Liparis tanakae]
MLIEMVSDVSEIVPPKGQRGPTVYVAARPDLFIIIIIIIIIIIVAISPPEPGGTQRNASHPMGPRGFDGDRSLDRPCTLLRIHGRSRMLPVSHGGEVARMEETAFIPLRECRRREKLVSVTQSHCPGRHATRKPLARRLGRDRRPIEANAHESLGEGEDTTLIYMRLI